MVNYFMFSEAGNSAVAKIIECAETAELSWDVVEAMLMVLAKDERYEEATDTVVRECVWEELYGA